MRKCTLIEAQLPENADAFGVADVWDPDLRKWLLRCIQSRKTGVMYPWQLEKLTTMGFDWQRPPRAPKKPRPKKAPSRKKATPPPTQAKWEPLWTSQLAPFIEATRESKDPMRALMLCGDARFRWVRRTLNAFRKGQLSPEQVKQLKAVDWPLDTLAQTTLRTNWRQQFTSLIQHISGHKKQRNAWSDLPTGLKQWLRRQWHARKQGTLAPWQIHLLEAEGIQWTEWTSRTRREKMEARWRANLEKLVRLEAEHGHPLTVQQLKSAGLASWMSRMRKLYQEGELSSGLIREFEARGFLFDARAKRTARYEARWERMFQRLLQFHQHFGHAQVPSSYREDPELGNWLRQQRERIQHHKLNPEKKKRLEAIGATSPATGSSAASTRNLHISAWLKAFNALKDHLATHHEGKVPEVHSRLPGNYANWLSRQRRNYVDGSLDDWQHKALLGIGYDLEAQQKRVQLRRTPGVARSAWPEEVFQENLKKVRDFVADEGHGHLLSGHPDRALARFAVRARTKWRKGTLPAEQLEALRSAGFCFDPTKEPSPAWMRHYERLKAFHSEHGHSTVPRQYPADQPLAEFCAQERQRGRKGKLLVKQIELLDALDFHWSGGHPAAKDA